MQLLAIVFFIFGSVFSGRVLSNERCLPSSIATSEILKCINRSYVAVDKLLNDRYKEVLGDENFIYRKQLVDGQRLWVKFRDSRCKHIYYSVYPGEEAGIERDSCVSSMTYFRFLELFYIETGWGGGEIKRISELAIMGDKGRMSSVYEAVMSASFGAEGDAYFRENCALVKILYEEDFDSCFFRMKVQNM